MSRRNNARIAGVLLAGLFSWLLAPGSAHAEHGSRARLSRLTQERVLNAASHFDEPDDSAGTIGLTSARIRRLGKFLITASLSWDWSSFSSEHRCALMHTVPHSFTTGINGPFTTTATLTFQRITGGEASATDVIDAKVIGGSVCEIVVDTVNNCTINEAFTAFEVTGGSGRYANASGRGHVHSIVDMCSTSPTFLLNEIVSHMTR